ncbi:hypothetical protein [Chryseobacterium sp. ERMR1:04]|uniref:hypothetical protein n=1 Tax=Chryseobacterium sp. ERMR1:04 TaxID=1705393 RepID=UPI0006C88782|nr:hypothetical protein [Chryseobacterium sp. ERMR1:04]KPH11692.1 hypothetical protein AMQ68_20155 [Chryseobacterium sp. ERMR1:04]
MKKILFTLFIGMSFIGCSNNDDDNTVQQTNPVNTQYFHVPNWIIGSYKISGTSTSYFIFEDDDFILVTPYTSYKTVLEQAKSAGQTAKVDETITDTDYNFVITAGASSGSYKFKKISATKIQWINGINNITLDKE